MRATHNCNTTAGEKVWDRLGRSAALGEVEFTLLAASNRPSRLMRQALYREAVILSYPLGMERCR